MIEIKREDPEKENFGTIYIDGKNIEHSKVGVWFRPNSLTYTIRSLDTGTSKTLLSHKFTEFPSFFENISFNSNINELPFLSYISLSPRYVEISISEFTNLSNQYKNIPEFLRPIIRTSSPYKSIFEVSFIFEPDLSNWSRRYTFSEYLEEFLNLINTNKQLGIKLTAYKNERLFTSSLEGIASFEIIDSPFEPSINKLLVGLAEAHRQVESKLLSLKQDNSIVLTFDFPDEVKAPCEQYLIYFSQFLRDLGVKATSDLSHEAGQVLFTVTPENPEQALDKIRTALEVYLQLPASPIDAYPDASTEIELQRHIANIQHFKGQLSLVKAELRAAESAIELKDTTIQLLQLTVDQQKRLLSGDISSSVKDVTPRRKVTDKEDLIEGIVSLKTYDAKVADVNIAEIWRRLKKLFKDKA